MTATSSADDTMYGIGTALVAVIVSIGLTVGFGLTGPWWGARWRGGRRGRDGGRVQREVTAPARDGLRRLARWLTQAP